MKRNGLIPHTFGKWLQVFAIGEKHQENCLVMFFYLDSISEAHRVYDGTAWFRNDKQFKQRKVIWPSLHWDHKDISLWMKLMMSVHAPI